MTSPRKLTSQLEMMAGEAAALYDSLCVLEGEQPFLDPHNAVVIDQILSKQAGEYRQLWGQDEAGTHR